MAEIVKSSFSDQVAARLREEIISGRLRSNERLSQDDLARRFKVSRIPVRDALRILESEGLVAYEPGMGARVTGLSIHDLEELYQIRMAIEPLNARLAVERLSDRDLAEMKSHLQYMRKSQNSRSWFSAHSRFHAALDVATDYKRLNMLIKNFRKQTERYLKVFRVMGTRTEQVRLLSEHQKIYEAAERRDPGAVEFETREHLRLIRDTLIDYLRSQPDEPA